WKIERRDFPNNFGTADKISAPSGRVIPLTTFFAIIPLRQFPGREQRRLAQLKRRKRQNGNPKLSVQIIPQLHRWANGIIVKKSWLFSSSGRGRKDSCIAHIVLAGFEGIDYTVHNGKQRGADQNDD
ncbi:MAG TPA: hypothetical protein VII90_06310, partial [Anaerolineales bacterium]